MCLYDICPVSSFLVTSFEVKVAVLYKYFLLVSPESQSLETKGSNHDEHRYKYKELGTQKRCAPGRSVLSMKLLWHKTNMAALLHPLSLPNLWTQTASHLGRFSNFSSLQLKMQFMSTLFYFNKLLNCSGRKYQFTFFLDSLPPWKPVTS